MNIKINISALFTAALLALSFAGCDNNKRIIPESQTDTINSPAADKGTLSSQPESTVQQANIIARTSKLLTDFFISCLPASHLPGPPSRSGLPSP